VKACGAHSTSQVGQASRLSHLQECHSLFLLRVPRGDESFRGLGFFKINGRHDACPAELLPLNRESLRSLRLSADLTYLNPLNPSAQAI
jgi:hypothetical protein